MGIFDFLKRKQPSPSGEQPDDDGPSLHYAFAHYAFRQVALDSPLQCLAILASAEAQQFLTAILESVSEELEQTPDFSVEAIKIHPVRIKDYPCVILEMPEPREITEAYFTGLVGLIDPTEELPSESESIPARYFTLEKGFSLEGDARTVVAEWSNSGHSNYGDGPEPTLDSFALAIKEQL